MARTQGAYSSASQAPMLQRVWQSMRVLRQFHTGELEATAEAGASQVLKYVRALSQAGYLRLQVPIVSGRPGSRNVWLLLRDSGPLAPICRRDGTGVYDPNTQIVWGAGGQQLRQAPPPAPPRLQQNMREALRQLHTLGTAKASGAVLAQLLRQGLVEVRLTDAGRDLAHRQAAAASQREGRALAEGEAHA